ncbi:hypothetical protein [Algiphilus sp.]|uniref:hypothetical protein n=1 Tax=Algiphilus sp. TaxID=1872431 RepID=UPI003BAC1C29
MSAADSDDLPHRLERMRSELHGSPHLQRLGALIAFTVLFEIDDRAYFLEFDRGRLVRVHRESPRKTPWRFALRIEEAALRRFWQPLPEPGYHDLFGLVKLGHARIEGEILDLIKNLRFFKEFLALGRQPETDA